MNNETLKRRNRGLILQMLAMETCKSRIEIARQSGLSKMTVTKIISEFIEQGLICEEEQIETKGLGRNPVCIQISPDAPKIVGVYVFREHCVALLCDLRLHVLKEHRIQMNEENAKHLDEVLFELVDAVMPDEGSVLGIGIGSIGQVDLERRILLAPTNFFGIRNFPIVEILENKYNLPVFLDSQYNCAALVEKYFGVAKEYQDFLFIGIANGIGSGIMSDGEILRNTNGYTSEVGHISIDWKGDVCSCGNRGCLEMYAGTNIIERKLNEKMGLSLSFREYCEMAVETENPVVEEGLTEMIDALAIGLVSYVNTLNPQVIILGHDAVYLPEKFRSMLEEKLNDMIIVGGEKHIEVLFSAFGNQTQELGGACSVLERMFRGEFV